MIIKVKKALKIRRKMKILRPIICFAFIVCSFVFSVYGISMLQCLRFKGPERDGCLLMVSTQTNIEQSKKVVMGIEEKTGTSRRKRGEVEAKGQEIEGVKEKHNLTELLGKTEKLDAELEKIGAKIFGSAPDLFYQLNNLLKKITQDLEVKTKLEKVFKLKREILERIEGDLAKIQDIGKDIITKTANARKELDTFKKEKFLPLQQELAQKSLQPEFVEELKKKKAEIMHATMELENELKAALTTTEKDRRAKISGDIERLRIMLDLIKDPEQIATIPPEKLLGW